MECGYQPMLMALRLLPKQFFNGCTELAPAKSSTTFGRAW
jgi:hypothetical protein